MQNKESALEKKEGLARDYIGWPVYAGLKIFLCALPLRVGYWIASLAGRCMYLFAKRSRRIVGKNLRGIGLDEPAIRKCTRRIFRNLCKNTVDFLSFQKLDQRWFRRYVEIEGLENIQKAISYGRGVLVVSAHLGYPEVAALLISMSSGFPVTGIAASHKNPKIEEFYVQTRLKKGLGVIIAESKAMGNILHTLAKNELVCFVMEYSYDRKGVEVEFFGHKILIPAGVAIAALRSGAVIVPGIGVRQGGLRYKGIYGDIIKYTPSGDIKKDVPEILQQCVKSLEQFIRAYPDQWVLFRDCWEKPPQKDNLKAK